MGYYIDDGVSGTTFDRKGFQSMIAEVEASALTAEQQEAERKKQPYKQRIV